MAPRHNPTHGYFTHPMPTGPTRCSAHRSPCPRPSARRQLPMFPSRRYNPLDPALSRGSFIPAGLRNHFGRDDCLPPKTRSLSKNDTSPACAFLPPAVPVCRHNMSLPDVPVLLPNYNSTCPRYSRTTFFLMRVLFECFTLLPERFLPF